MTPELEEKLGILFDKIASYEGVLNRLLLKADEAVGQARLAGEQSAEAIRRADSLLVLQEAVIEKQGLIGEQAKSAIEMADKAGQKISGAYDLVKAASNDIRAIADYVGATHLLGSAGASGAADVSSR